MKYTETEKKLIREYLRSLLRDVAQHHDACAVNRNLHAACDHVACQVNGGDLLEAITVELS